MKRIRCSVACLLALGLGSAGCAVTPEGELIVLDGLWSVRSTIVHDDCGPGAAEAAGLLPDLVSIENDGLIWMRVDGPEGFFLTGEIDSGRSRTRMDLDGDWDFRASDGTRGSVHAYLDAEYFGSSIEGRLHGSVTLDRPGRPPVRCEVETELRMRRT
jgi:hypothetical protein